MRRPIGEQPARAAPPGFRARTAEEYARSVKVGRRREPLRAVLRAFAVLVALGLLCAAGPLAVGGWVVTRDADRRARVRAGFDRRVARLRASRWRRPVLRGEPRDCNASDAQRLALDGLPRVDTDLADFAELRASTQCAYAMTRPSLDAARMQLDDAAVEDHHDRVKAAIEAMLPLAAMEDPALCLVVGADAVRIVQDRAPGRPVTEITHLVPHLMGWLQTVLLDCAADAPRDAVAVAAREMALLARHAPPTGWSLEIQLLRSVAEQLAYLETFPGMVRRPTVLDQIEHNLAFAPSYSVVLPADYPAAFGPTRREAQACQSRFGAGCHDDGEYVVVDAAGHARLRMLAVALAALAAEPVSEVAPPPPMPPPIELQEPALRDPFSGEPFRWESSEEARTAFMSSVGPDPLDESDDIHLRVVGPHALDAEHELDADAW
ncbi:MAG: hypothetical protein IT379_14595 [Deltaproteobacteria bacterium]|nr:hypothetical protein [Deltaproteobacteria bacterium]